MARNSMTPEIFAGLPPQAQQAYLGSIKNSNPALYKKFAPQSIAAKAPSGVLAASRNQPIKSPQEMSAMLAPEVAVQQSQVVANPQVAGSAFAGQAPLENFGNNGVSVDTVTAPQATQATTGYQAPINGMGDAESAFFDYEGNYGNGANTQRAPSATMGQPNVGQGPTMANQSALANAESDFFTYEGNYGQGGSTPATGGNLPEFGMGDTSQNQGYNVGDYMGFTKSGLDIASGIGGLVGQHQQYKLARESAKMAREDQSMRRSAFNDQKAFRKNTAANMAASI